MKNHWRILYSLLPQNLERKMYEKFFRREDESRRKSDTSLLPSNLAKHKVLKRLKQEYNLNTLVETGTYLGDTLYSLYNDFDRLYSIELSNYYFIKAGKRFKNYDKIQLINGDSGKALHRLVPELKEPSLFWLDGHYSGGLTAKGDKDCPVYEELLAIFSSELSHIIVIDDARLFIGKNDYPTLSDLKEFVRKHKPSYRMFVENDSIRLIPEAKKTTLA